MKSVEQKIEFYYDLAWILSGSVFVESAAEAVVQTYKKVKKTITCDLDFSVDFLKKLHYAYYNEVCTFEDYDILDKIVKSVFRDLAKHLRNPKARQVVDCFINISGEDSDTILFVSKTNEMEVGDGFVVVTLVVSSSEGLDQLLSLNAKPRNNIEKVHLV